MNTGINVVTAITDLLKYRELLYSITLRSIKVRYKQSLLGMAWSVLQPLSTMIVFTVVFSRFAGIPSDGIPYPIFSYAALLPWGFFANSLSLAIPSVVSNANLVTKIYFPREIFPIAAVLSATVDFGVASAIFALMMIFYRVAVTWHFILVIPLLLTQIMLALGISFWASAINVRYRDVRYALPLVIQLWMYVTPIVYPVSVVPERFRPLYMVNPMASIIDGYRQVVLKHALPDLHYLGLAILISLGLFLVSYAYFKKQETTFADII